jgi:hypothetical protein
VVTLVEMGVAMSTVRRFQVLPLYHQVEVRDAGDVDYPQWETGEERVLASVQCIVLATRSDLEGDVAIEVRIDAGPEDRAAGALVFAWGAADHRPGDGGRQLAYRPPPYPVADRLAPGPGLCRSAHRPGPVHRPGYRRPVSG